MTTPASPRWLPGILAVGSLYMLAGAMLFYTALSRWPHGTPRTLALVLGAALVAGAAGLLALRRWGWAMTAAGSIVLATLCGWAFARSHASNWLVWCICCTVIFLYLVRTSVRERTH